MIKAENVNYIYQQGMPFERQALYDVNIEIEDGSLVALIGHTGSGKSALQRTCKTDFGQNYY